MIDFKHSRDTVRFLHQAHADYIEATYTGLSQIPENPYGVIIRQFGQTRTFLQKEADWSSRAILIGTESYDLLDEIIAHFRENSTACFIEINPANFSQSQQPFWKHKIMPHLVKRGFQPDILRCVWIYDNHKISSPKRSNHAIEITAFSRADFDLYYPRQLEVSGGKDDEVEKTALKYSHAVGNWTLYIATLNRIAAATATLFIKGEVGYLAWGFTNEQYRHQGCHTALIQKRIADALTAGCTTIFSVSDIDANSASTLQSCGFRLAYNYVMMTNNIRVT